MEKAFKTLMRNGILEVVPSIIVYCFLAGLALPFLEYWEAGQLTWLSITATLVFITLGIVLHKKVYKSSEHWKTVKEKIKQDKEYFNTVGKEEQAEILANELASWSGVKFAILLLAFVFGSLLLIAFILQLLLT